MRLNEMSITELMEELGSRVETSEQELEEAKEQLEEFEGGFTKDQVDELCKLVLEDGDESDFEDLMRSVKGLVQIRKSYDQIRQALGLEPSVL